MPGYIVGVTIKRPIFAPVISIVRYYKPKGYKIGINSWLYAQYASPSLVNRSKWEYSAVRKRKNCKKRNNNTKKVKNKA